MFPKFQSNSLSDSRSDELNLSPKICCLFKNLAINSFTFTAFHSADIFSNGQQIFGLTFEVSFFGEDGSVGGINAASWKTDADSNGEWIVDDST